MSVEVTTCNGYIDAGARIFNRTPHPFLNVPLQRSGDARADHCANDLGRISRRPSAPERMLRSISVLASFWLNSQV